MLVYLHMHSTCNSFAAINQLHFIFFVSHCETMYLFSHVCVCISKTNSGHSLHKTSGVLKQARYFSDLPKNYGGSLENRIIKQCALFTHINDWRCQPQSLRKKYSAPVVLSENIYSHKYRKVNILYSGGNVYIIHKGHGIRHVLRYILLIYAASCLTIHISFMVSDADQCKETIWTKTNGTPEFDV